MKKYVVLALTLAFAILIAACAAPTPVPPPPATAVPAPTAVPTPAAYVPKAGELGSADKPFVMTFVPSGDTGKIAKAGQGIADLVSKQTGWAYKIEVGTSEAASIEAMGGNKAQVGFLNTFAIILAKAKYDIDVALVNQRIYIAIAIDPDKDLTGKITPYYKAEFLTKVGSGIKTYADLKGKSFCFTSAGSTSGNIVPRIILKANGIDPDKDMKSTFAGGHDKAALAVYQGDCDAGVTFVDTLTDQSLKLYEKFPDIATKVTAFGISDRIPNDGVQFVKGLDPRVRDATVKALTAVAADPAGKQLLKDLYNIDGFEVAGYDKYYKPFEDILKKAGVDASAYVK
ncbi:MAG: phosphate/phosphite/phosphonate ABC transporter substrate-binding protein [Chloroflexi bacterium]|nr:phosphate/phosphite/phosphonate ABC transporter substrate-binding protein [Chloroflexota bacterium]